MFAEFFFFHRSYPLSSVCCSAIASLCRIAILAFSNVRAESSCSFCESASSLIPTTSRSRNSSSLNAPYSQFSTRLYNAVINCSADSPSSWCRLFFRKWCFFVPWNNHRISVVSYFFRSSSVGFVDRRTSSTWSPHAIQQCIHLSQFTVSG